MCIRDSYEGLIEVEAEGCRIARTGDAAALKAWWDSDPTYFSYGLKFDPNTRKLIPNPANKKLTHLNNPSGRKKKEFKEQYPDTWYEDQPTMYDYDVERSGGKLLPSLSAAIRPARWLEAVSYTHLPMKNVAADHRISAAAYSTRGDTRSTSQPPGICMAA